jgi:hypothetical protein
MNVSLPLVNTGEDFIGWIKPEVLENMKNTLHERGFLATDIDITQVYTLQLLQQIYSR